MVQRRLSYRTTALEIVSNIDLRSKTALVTGGLGPLGSETCRALAQSGATVIFTSKETRKSQDVLNSLRESTKNPRIFAMELDLASFMSIRTFVKHFTQQFPQLHILICNATVIATPYGKTVNGIETQFGINHLGHFLLVNLLMQVMVASAPARVICVSSIAHKRPVINGVMGINFNDINSENGYDKLGAYAQSKTANILFAVELNRRMFQYGVTANAVHPGGVGENLQRYMEQEEMVARGWATREDETMELFKTPEQGAALSVYLATAPEVEGQGGFYFESFVKSEIDDSHIGGSGVPKGVGSWAVDPEIAKKLWQVSELMVGERFNCHWYITPRISVRPKGLIVISGANSAVGKSIACKFAQEGYPLLLLVKKKEKVEDLGLQNIIVKDLDITNITAVGNAINNAEGTFGPTQLFISNPGIMLMDSMIDQSPSQWEDMINANVISVLNGIKAILQPMIERKNGTIINISSIAGIKSFENYAVYCATKAAVRVLSEGIRMEIAEQGIRCACINPGMIETEVIPQTTNQSVFETNNFWREDEIKLNQLIPSDIADLCFYIYDQPQRECIREVTLASTYQKL